MIALEFMDTNILVYAYDDRNPEKSLAAQELVDRAITGDIAISTQVLAELSTTLLHKMSPKFSTKAVATILVALAPIRLVTIARDIARRALEAHASYGVRFYDGMILAAAERGGCKRIWSEDFNSGQQYFGISIQNPFA